MDSRSRAGWLVMAGMLALLVAGCTKPPVAEQQAAQTAKDTATAVKAESYATTSMNEALRLWDAAEAKMKQQAYAEAKAAYLAAKTAFEKATDEVEAGKQLVIEENLKIIQPLEKNWTALQNAAKRRIFKMRGVAKTTWETDTKLITSALKLAKDAATDPAELKKSLEEANKLVSKWLEAFKK